MSEARQGRPYFGTNRVPFEEHVRIVSDLNLDCGRVIDRLEKKVSRRDAKLKDVRSKAEKLEYRLQKLGDIGPLETRLVELRKEKRIIEHLVEHNQSIQGEAAEDYKMPPVPPPLPGDPPEASGVYFLWDRYDHVAYVGQSVNLFKRTVNWETHHRMEKTDRKSWLELPKEELLFAECFYMWLCRPYRNGARPFHNYQ